MQFKYRKRFDCSLRINCMDEIAVFQLIALEKQEDK